MGNQPNSDKHQVKFEISFTVLKNAAVLNRASTHACTHTPLINIGYDLGVSRGMPESWADQHQHPGVTVNDLSTSAYNMAILVKLNMKISYTVCLILIT